MANEYLQRTPTSTGNRKVWTISVWIKLSNTSSTSIIRTSSSGTSAESGVYFNSSRVNFEYYNGPGQNYYQIESPLRRDFSSWSHVLVSCDSTKVDLENERTIIYVNGVRTSSLSADMPLPFNTDTFLNLLGRQVNIGSRPVSSADQFFQGEIADFFLVDGQALTPDVFGFYKAGKGYISVGSTQSTDFRPGQWVPKTPRVIKTAINNNGGFGVNGFYLPMNDSNNFGADFHCDPNSIIKLQENLPQPRSRIDGVGDYTGALRDDPFKQYLVLALPFVSGGLQNGFGDYSAAIRGSGSAKVGTLSNSPSIVNTAGYYGSALSINGTGSGASGSPVITFASNADFSFGSSPYTIECWLNPSTNTSHDAGVVVVGDSGAQTAISYTNGIIMFRGPSGSVEISSPTYSQVNQWFHTAIVRETGSNIKLYVNGVCVGVKTNFTSTLSQDKLNIGAWAETGIHGFNGQIQDLRIYKGVAKYKGGFDVPRPYTPVGIATWRAVPDTTANNFATWNPLDRARNTGTQTDGNLSTATNTGNYAIRSTVGVSTGKWYWEFCPTAGTITNHHGIVAVGRSMGAFYLGETLDSWGMYDSNGNKRNNGSFDSYGTGFSQYDVGMVALDKSNGKIWWGKNGTWFASGNPSNATNEAFSNINIVCSGIGTDSFVSPSQLQYNSCSYNFGQNPSFSGNTTAGTYTDSNNKGLFKYQPPSGFLALCEDNLPTPAISDPGKYFRTVLYRGSGASRNLVGIGFTPDLVWIKGRDVQTNNHVLFDSVRGATSGGYLMSAQTSAEYPNSTMLLSFDNDGFSLGSDNTSAANNSSINYVAWCWKAGAGTTSTNTNGSITSVVSVNQDAGFSIVSYTGTGANATVGHGLGKVPKMVIIKQRSLSGYSWVVYHSGLTNANYYVALESTIGQTSVPALFNSTAPTSSVFSIGTETAVSGTGNNIIAYCWAEIEGYSKFGSYTGNGSADGPFIYTGGRPAFVMIKRTDSTQNWPIIDSSRDSVNVANRRLFANLYDIEDQGIPNFVDILSNGFKCRDSNVSYNASGGTYIFACWMESPFTTANSK